MKTINDNLKMFQDILDLLSNHFGQNCEIILCDTKNSSSPTIIDIRNGHITGRKTGDHVTNLGMELCNKPSSTNYNKIIHMHNGKILRSSSMCIHDEEGHPIGVLSINMDITDSLRCEDFLRQLNMYPTSDISNSNAFSTDVNHLLDTLLKQCESMFDKPISYLNKDEKMKIIHYLDEKGAFLITKSGDRVCEFLNISKFTLYNYLENTRQIPIK